MGPKRWRSDRPHRGIPTVASASIRRARRGQKLHPEPLVVLTRLRRFRSNSGFVSQICHAFADTGRHERTPRRVKLSTGGHGMNRRDTGGHEVRRVRDREAPGSNPGSPTILNSGASSEAIQSAPGRHRGSQGEFLGEHDARSPFELVPGRASHLSKTQAQSVREARPQRYPSGTGPITCIPWSLAMRSRTPGSAFPAAIASLKLSK